MEKDEISSKLLDSISPTSILDALAESIIDLVRPAAIARLQEHDPSNQDLIVMHKPIESGVGSGSGSLSVHSGVNFCQITVILNPILPKPHTSHLPQLRRRCLRRGPVNIFMSPQSIEITRHESQKIPSGICTSPSLSWIRSLFDSDPKILPWKRGSLDVLPIIVERLNAGIRGFEKLFQLATEYKSDSKVPQILGAVHTLKQMIRVLSPGVEKSGGKGIDKRKRCSVELFASGSSNIPHKSMGNRYGSDSLSMEEVVEDIGSPRGVMEDPEEHSDIVNKMKKLCCML